jgi:hypothetical protein
MPADLRPPPPADPDTVLAELLQHCRSATEECFRAGYDGTFDVNRRDYRLAGVKLVKASLEIIDAMKGGRTRSPYRFVYERQGDTPPPGKKNGGTTRTTREEAEDEAHAGE